MLSSNMEELRGQYQSRLDAINGIQVNAVPLYNTVVSGVKQDLPVLFQVMSGKNTGTVQRKPLNVAVVLDRSGSMDGEKLDNSKKAVKQLINELGPEDRLHFVVYDDRVETILTNVTGATARDSVHKVDNVRVGGCTNLFGGVERGVKLVLEHQREGAIDAVFLFSDGQVNAGSVQKSDDIGSRIKKIHQEKGVRFTCFGIGADFNEHLMSSISRVGRGNYFFIDEMERIPELVRKAYNGFTKILAENLTLKVRGLGGTVINELTGCTDLPAGKKWDLMREYGFYQVLANTTIVPTAVGASDFSLVGDVPILEWQLTFTDLQTGELETRTGSVAVRLADGFETPAAAPAVVVYQTMVECGKLNETASKALRNHDRKLAIDTKKDVIARYEKVQELDEFGFIAALLTKERAAVKELEREGITARSAKICSYTTSAAPGASTAYVKGAYEDPCEEEDGDMGFGMFD